MGIRPRAMERKARKEEGCEVLKRPVPCGRLASEKSVGIVILIGMISREGRS